MSLILAACLDPGPVWASHPPLYLLQWGSAGADTSQFNQPRSMAVDADGDIFVVDDQNHRIQKFAPDGTFLMSWGSFGTGNGQFIRPFGVAIGPSGDIYISETGGDRIQRFTSSGAFVLKWGSLGAGNGQFSDPLNIATDASGNVYVADRNNHRVQKFTANGGFIGKWGTLGTGNGQFTHPFGITVDSQGSVYVTELSNHRVQKFSGTGAFIRRWGSLGSGAGAFNAPRGISAVGTRQPGGAHAGGITLLIADSNNHRVQAFTEIGVFLHQWGGNGSGNGKFITTMYCTADSGGNLYVSDLGNNRIQKFTPPPVASGGECLSVEVYATFRPAPVGLSFNATDDLFVGNNTGGGANATANTIIKVSGVDQSVSAFGGSIVDPDAILVDRVGYLGTAGSVLVGGNTGSTGTITRIGPTGSPTTPLVSSVQILNPHLMEFDSTGRLYVGAFGPAGASPLRISYIVGSTVTNILTLSEELRGFALDSTDNLYITWDGITRKYSRSGALLDPAFVIGSAFTFCSSGPFEGLIITRSGQVISVDVATKAERVLLTGASVTDVDFNSIGEMFISEQGHARVLRVYFDDTMAPELELPADVGVSADPGACSAFIPESALGTADAPDECSTATITRFGVPAGNIYPVGTTEIVYKAVDQAGNETCGSQMVTVIDEEAPTLTVPGDLAAVATGQGAVCAAHIGDEALGLAEATDNCTDSLIVARSGVPDGNLFPPGVTTITYSVVDSSGNEATGTQTVEVTVPGGAVTGLVYADCPGPETPLLGVGVGAYDSTGALVGTGVTATDGAYAIPAVPAGVYTVTIVTPLGYLADAEDVAADLSCGGTAEVDFALTCVPAPDDPRATGFWKHQVGVATGGNGAAQVDGAALCQYLDLIENHFNSNAVNQVVIYEPPASGQCSDKLQVAKVLLNLKGNVGITARAKQQLTALLLNVAAGYLGLTPPVSVDGATCSQAITYCDNLIDGPVSGHETAKTIAGLINNNQTVPAGMIPLTTADIAYRRGVASGFVLAQNHPNPFSSRTLIRLALPEGGAYEVGIHDVAGRLVRSFVGQVTANEVSINWDGTDDQGNRMPDGIYFYSAHAGAYHETRRMILVR